MYRLQQVSEIENASLETLIREAKIGERIILYEGLCSDYEIYPAGYDFYHVDQGTLHKNGEAVCEEVFEDWFAHRLGFVIKRGNQYLMNGTEVVAEGDFIDWAPHKEGVVVLVKVTQKPEGAGDGEEISFWEVRLNGTKVLHRQNRELRDLAPHSRGFMVGCYGDWSINGSKPLVSNRRKRCDGLHPWGDSDFVVKRGGEFRLNDVRVIHRDFCDSWTIHRNGIVVKQDDEVSLVVLRK